MQKQLHTLFLLCIAYCTIWAQHPQVNSPWGTEIQLPHQQQLEKNCGFQPTQQQIDAVDNDPAFQEAYRTFLSNYGSRALQPITYVPIKAHIVRTSAGTGGLTVAELNAAMTNMNNYYLNANMQFYICDGINFIDDNTYYDFDQTEEAALHGAEGVANLINIYFCNTVSTSGGGALCGYAYFPGGPDVIMMANSCTTNGSTLPHEMGHFFALYHTHGTANGTLTDELVNGSNCTTNGDRVCDTPADPQLGNANVSAACNFNNTAPYTGGVNTDANGDVFAPNPNNIMSYSRKACRNFFSPGQYARIYATYTTQRNYFTCPTFNVDFSATPTSACSTPLTVNFTDNSVGATAWQWDVDGDNVVDYTTQNPSHVYNTPGSYDVRLTISNGSETIFTTKTTFVTVGAQGTLPYTQDFESATVAYNATGFPNAWTTTPSNTTAAYRWNVNAGNTLTGGGANSTGPLVDNTLGTAAGIYAYTEASQGANGDVAELISPCIAISGGSPQLEFAYHMNGLDINELHVDAFVGGAWVNDITPVLSGQQHASQADAFSNRTVSLAAYTGQTIKIRFRAIRGGNFRGDIAIDDINITTNPEISFATATATQMEASISGAVDCRGYVDLNIPIQITEAPTGDAVVTFSAAGTSNGTYDYQILTPSVTFTNGSAAAQNVQVRIFDDANDEANESLVLSYTVSGTTNATAGIANQTHTITIQDNDGLNTGTAVATALETRQLYFGPNETVYFYNAGGDIMAKLENTSGWDYGCTTVQIDRAGTGAVAYDDNSAQYYAARKTFLITPTNNSATGQYNVTLYYSANEMNTWEAATSNVRTNLNVRKTGGAASNITPGTPLANGATNYNGGGTSRAVHGVADYGITASFNTGFSGFVVGQNPTILLQTVLTEFDGYKLNDQQNYLTWSLSEQIGTDYFEVERSTDGVSFVRIGQVDGQQSTGEQLYNYNDQDVITRELCYYRLRHVDLDGKEDYSNIISISGNNEAVKYFEIYPNPSTGIFNVLFESLVETTVPIEVYNSVGQIVQSEVVGARQGKNEYSIDLTAYPKGIYLVKVKYQDNQYHRFVIKQ